MSEKVSPRARPVRAPKIRRANPNDWAAASGLLREMDDLHARIAPAYFCSGIRAADEWRRLLEDDSAAALVAEGLDHLVGLVVVRIYDTPQSPTMVPRRRGHVETLVVGTRHRRRGIGRRLMDEAASWAGARGAVELVLTTWKGNRRAEAFYRRLGYRALSLVLSRPLGDGMPGKA